MKIAAVMMVRDEADIVGYTIDHLFAQGIDRLYVADNRSVDGTPAILVDAFARYGAERVDFTHDPEVAYWQSAKTTGLARRALADGFDWVVPVDADEWWYSPHGTLVEQLARYDDDGVDVVGAELFDHIPTAVDSMLIGSPVERIGWRFREPGKLLKVAVRLREDVVIGMGNHTASYERSAPRWSSEPGLTIRHFSWRSEGQYVRKITNGAEAYAATDLDPDVGSHWRMFGEPSEEGFADRVAAHFREWFWSPDPVADDRLIYDPAPRP